MDKWIINVLKFGNSEVVLVNSAQEQRSYLKFNLQSIKLTRQYPGNSFCKNIASLRVIVLIIKLSSCDKKNKEPLAPGFDSSFNLCVHNDTCKIRGLVTNHKELLKASSLSKKINIVDTTVILLLLRINRAFDDVVLDTRLNHKIVNKYPPLNLRFKIVYMCNIKCSKTMPLTKKSSASILNSFRNFLKARGAYVLKMKSLHL